MSHYNEWEVKVTRSTTEEQAEKRNEEYTVSATGMLKHTGGKAHVELVPAQWVIWLAEGMGYGAYLKKPVPYGPMNWARGGKASMLTSAAHRHLLAYIGGEKLDKDSRKSHLVHCAMNCLMLLTLESLGKLEDDTAFYRGEDKT